jgi:hypothetical protein
MKRGLTYAEAMAYVGVKRRTFDAAWRPCLRALHQGTCLIFDREEIDALFDTLKSSGSEQQGKNVLEQPQAQNTRRNERPEPMKGVSKWAEKYPGSTPEMKEPGRSTSGTPALDFSGVASRILTKRKSG